MKNKKNLALLTMLAYHIHIQRLCLSFQNGTNMESISI